MQQDVPTTSTAKPATTLVVSGEVGGLIAIIVLVAGALVFSGQQVSAKPEFSAQTKLPCGQCHKNPAGGGALKPFGQKFKANGFKIK
jgi:hypothetical protein